MRVKYQFAICSQEKVLSKGEGECSIKDPIMVTAQIPIEREQYNNLKAACIEQKLSIYDLLVRTLNQDPDEIRYII